MTKGEEREGDRADCLAPREPPPMPESSQPALQAPSFSRLTRSVARRVTVIAMAGNYLAGEPSRGHLPGASHERQWSASVALAACAGLAMVLGHAPVPLVIVLGLGVFFVASRMPRRWSVPATAVTAAGLGTALLYAALAGRTGSLPALVAVQGFVPLVAAWFVGDSVATRRHYLAGLAEQAERERAAEAERARQQVREERVRIARELHDVVAHLRRGGDRRLDGRLVRHRRLADDDPRQLNSSLAERSCRVPPPLTPPAPRVAPRVAPRAAQSPRGCRAAPARRGRGCR